MRGEKFVHFVRRQLYTVARRKKLDFRLQSGIPLEEIPRRDRRRLENGGKRCLPFHLDFAQRHRAVGAQVRKMGVSVGCDIDDGEKFLPIPDKRELDLGPLALKFARQFLPGDFEEVRQFFSQRGAYARFKDLLARRNALDRWYDFETKAEERALRTWCDLNSIEVCDE